MALPHTQIMTTMKGYNFETVEFTGEPYGVSVNTSGPFSQYELVITINSNGLVQEFDTINGPIDTGRWISQQPTNNYWVRFTPDAFNTTSFYDGDTLNVWLPLNISKRLSYTVPQNQNISINQFAIEIASDSIGSNILDSGSASISTFGL